jgi:hypothetical protein
MKGQQPQLMIEIRNSILTVLMTLLALSELAIAQANVLLIEDIAGNPVDGELPVIIELLNEDPLAGFQFTLDFNAAYLTLHTVGAGDRLTDLDVFYSSPEPGQVTVMVISMAGKTIPPGAGPALQLSLSITPGAPALAETLSISDVVFSNPAGANLPGTGLDGYVIIGDMNALRLQDGYSSNVLELYNEIPLGGIQFTLEYESSLSTLDTVHANVRSEHMLLDYNEPEPGSVIVILYSTTGDSLDPAMGGGLVEFIFNDIDDSSAVVNQLHLTDVTLSRTGGEVVPVQAIDGYHIIVTSPETVILPGGITLHQNYPNPFNSTTVINFELPQATDVSLIVYNLLGQEVVQLKNTSLRAGFYHAWWAGQDNAGRLVPAGLYFAMLKASGQISTIKMLLLK